MSGGQTLRRTVYLGWLLIALLGPALILAPAAAQERTPVPGEVDAHVTQATIHSTICEPWYTAKVSPPRKVTDAIKRRLVNGLPGSSQDYELDHLIPIGLGGHPVSPKNLWLQTWPEAAVKDRDALGLHRAVCAGRMTLEQAQRKMLATWGPRGRKEEVPATRRQQQ
jgi:hypothetical protein